MAGINGFGAGNYGNYGNNVNKAGQKAQNLKQQGVANNQAEALTFKKTDALDGFVKTTTTQNAKKEDKGEKTEDKKADNKKETSKLKTALKKAWNKVVDAGCWALTKMGEFKLSSGLYDSRFKDV